MIVEKKCSKCGEVKPTEEFYGKGRNVCKLCRKKYQKEYNKKNKEKIKHYNEERYKNNKEYYKDRHREYYENNKEYIRDRHKEYRKEYNKEYCKKNVIKINNERFYLPTVPDKLKPIIKTVIEIRDLKRDLRLNRKKIEKGEI